MQKINSWKRLSIILGMLLLLTACGQKGDLYLPEGKVITAWIGLL